MFNKNGKLIEKSFELIDAIEKQSNFDTSQPHPQVNYKFFSEQPEKIKDIIVLYKKIYEKYIPHKYNSINIPKVSEITPVIRNNLTKLLENYKNINNNTPNSLSQDTNQNLNDLYKKFKNEYSVISRDYIDVVNDYLKFLKLLFEKLYDLKNNIKTRELEFEKMDVYLKNLQNDDPKVEESIRKMHRLFAEIVGDFNQINIIISEVLEINELNNLDDIKKIKDDISKENSNCKDIEINNYFKNIFSYIEEFEGFCQQIRGYIKDSQKYKIKEDNILSNEDSRLDILIILDTTNSMGKYLKKIQKELKRVIETIKKNCPSTTIYLGFIGYKDFYDLELGDEYTDINLTKDYDSVYEQIKDIEVDGGDDLPEDVAGAFQKALNKRWGNGTKLAFLITDAPCHGIKYHDLDQNNKLFKDNYPDGYYKGEEEDSEEFRRENIEDLVQKFAEKDIYLVCFTILQYTDKMFGIFQEIYNKNNKSNLFSIEKDKNKIDKIFIQKATDLMKKKEETFFKFLVDKLEETKK